MLMLKNFKQLRKDEVKYTSNLPFSPIPHMNLLLMLPYVFTCGDFWDYFVSSLQDCIKVTMTLFLHAWPLETL